MDDAIRESGKSPESEFERGTIAHALDIAEALNVDPCGWFPARGDFI